MLVLDDEELITELIATVLADEGFEVRTACAPEAALVLTREWAPQVLVVDVWLGRANGMDVAEELQSRVSPRPAVLFLSAVIQEKRLAPPPYPSYMPKPFDLSELTDWVGRLAAGQSAAATDGSPEGAADGTPEAAVGK